MTPWQLTPNDPLALQIAADARLSPTDYYDDQVWELMLGSQGNPALALQTGYGGRVGLASLVPLWRIDNRAVYQYQAYSTPPVIAAFAPGYLQASARITPRLTLTAEFRVIDSHSAGARLTIQNAGAALDLGFDLVAFVGSQGHEMKLALQPLPNGGSALLLGKVGNLNPVVIVENGKGGSDNRLSLDFKVPANDQFVIQWIHVGLPNLADSLAQAQAALKKSWINPLRHVTQAAQAIPSIETGDSSIDATLAFGYQQLVQSFLRPTASLPHASFVAERQPNHGYSPSGTDYPRTWGGQNPMLAYLSALALAPISAEMAQGVIRNYLAVQRADGWIDARPGLAGQQQGSLCPPLLARLTWGIWQYTEDDAFLSEAFPGLLRFFERWLACDADHDGFPEWESEAQMGYPFMPSFALRLPWGQNAEIKYFEPPDLLAYLLSEATSLREIAYYLRRSDDEARLNGRIEGLTAALETLWNSAEQRYVYRDRDTHQTTGSVTVLQDGRGDEDHILAIKLTPPNRLIVEVVGGLAQAPKMKLRLSGIDASGNRVQEDSDTFVWTQGRGVYTSKNVFTQIDRIRAEGIASVYHISARTMATNEFDLNGLLPLWIVGIPADHADALVKHLSDPAQFWRANGILMFSARDPYYDPARAAGSVGVWSYWLTLIGEGLIEHNRLELATALIKRYLTAQTAVLRSGKAFYEFYHADETRGMGERANTMGLPPLHLLLRVIGVRILSKSRVWTGGSFFWDSPITVTLHGVSVTRSAQGTRIRFPSGDTVNLPADAPWQEVTSKKS